MLGLGLASSHAPAMFEPVERWAKVYGRIPEYTKQSQPHTAALETPEVISGYIERIDASFEELRRQLEAYRPDALIMIGDDQGELYDKSINPAFSIFAGTEIWGLSGTNDTPVELRSRITFPCHAELGHVLLKGLIKRGFDIASSEEFKPLGRPDHGAPHMVTRPVQRITPNLDVPIIPVYINEYYPPQPTAARCLDLGRAIADVLSDRPERIAICASGGLSHDPTGPRAGWVDEPLDRWILERLERNDTEALTHLFTFDSDTMRAGTGEIRAWISVAGAMNRRANVVDYMRIHHAKTGCAFAYWPAVESEDVVSAAARIASSV